MIRRLYVIAFVLVVGLAESGCTTQLLLDAAKTPIVTSYRASHAESGWRSDSGETVVCVVGWTTGQPVSGPSQSYAMTVPAGIAESVGVSHGAAYDARAVMTWSAARKNIEDGCGERPASASPLEVWRIPVRGPDGGGPAVRKLLYEALAEADSGDTGPVIFSVDDWTGDGTGVIVYRRKVPPGGGARFVRLDPPNGTTYEYNAAVLLLPITVVVDVVLFLAYVYLCSEAPGSC